MPLCELNIHFPRQNQFFVKFGAEESQILAFRSPVTKRDLDDLRWYIEVYGSDYTSEPDDKDVKERIEPRLISLGEDLFNAVFTTHFVRNLFCKFQQQHTNKLLTIHTHNAEILTLPWELLHDPQSGFLCHQQSPISIRRYCVKNHYRNLTIHAKPKLRLLFVVSRPSNADFLDPRFESQAVLNALATKEISQIEVEFLRPASLKKLVDRLENKMLAPVDIVHFDGHGVYDEINQLGYILFEHSRGGGGHLVTAAQLGEILASHRIAFVVLSACQSATIGNDPFASVAAGLTDQGVPTVLAMAYSVLMQSTRLLFTYFYQQLATGHGIGAALDSARKQMVIQNQRGTRQRGDDKFEIILQDWFVPALYSIGQNDVLLQSKAPDIQKTAPCHNLPALQTAGFFGRSWELWQIESWFVQGVKRITITGFGGQGKTYLATEAANWLLQTDLFDAVCFVDFSHYQGEDALRYAMNSLGVLLVTTLLDENEVPPLLQKYRLVWVWDNLESLATKTLEELLMVAVRWSTQCHFILTTRQNQLTHEDYAKDKDNPKHSYLQLKGLAKQDALAYFNQLWQTAPLAEQPYPVLSQLLALFDKVAFHPLSIGLLAQRLKIRTIEELGGRLEALLLCDLEDSQDKSLSVSLKLCLELLQPEEYELVKRLGVFQGGAFEDDLLTISKISDREWIILRPTLENIGLIQAEDLSHLNVKFPYIKLHPTLASTLWQELNMPQQVELSESYRQSYFQLSNFLYVEDNENPNFSRTIAWKEMPNLLNAVYAALQAGDVFAVMFANNVSKLLYQFGLQRDRAVLINTIQNVCSENGSENWYLIRINEGDQLFDAGHYQQAESIFDEIFHHLEKTPNDKLLLVLMRLGRCSEFQGNSDIAIEFYEQSLKMAQQLENIAGMQRVVCLLQHELATSFKSIGDYSRAKIYFEQSLAFANEIGDTRHEATVKTQLGNLAGLQYDFMGAVQLYHSALERFQVLNEPQMESNVLNNLGTAYANAKKWTLAEQFYRESAAIDEGLDNLVSAAVTWDALAIIMLEQNKLEAAENWFRKAIQVLRLGGDPVSLANSLNNVAGLLKNQPNRLDEALQFAHESLAIRKTLNESSATIWITYKILAELAEKQKNYVQRKEYLRLSRDSYLRFAGMPYQMQQWVWLIAKVTLAALTGKTDMGLENNLSNIKLAGGKSLVTAIKLILDGERNEATLLEPLDYGYAAIIHLILRGIKNPESLENLFNS